MTKIVSNSADWYSARKQILGLVGRDTFFLNNPYAVSLSQDKLSRFDVYDTGDDLVWVFYKHVRFFKAQYKVLTCFPKSQKGITENAIRVFMTIRSDYKYIFDSNPVFSASAVETYYNFNNVPSEELRRVNRSAYRTKYGVSRYVYRKATQFDADAIHLLVSDWVSKTKAKTTLTHNGMYKVLSERFGNWCLNTEVTNYVLEYQGKIVGLQSYVPNYGGLYQLVNICSDTGEQHNRAMYYHLINTFSDSVGNLCYGVSTKESPGLFRYKEMMYKTSTLIYRVPIEKFILLT